MTQMLDKINAYIDNLPLEVEPKGLYEPIRYVLSLGGKRIRPQLMMMAYELWRENGEDVLPQAVALETYHNFTLLHDDVMDGDHDAPGRVVFGLDGTLLRKEYS